MTAFQWIASFALTTTIIVPVLQAEPRCPGNVPSLPFQLIHRSQIIVPVTVNHAGPYDFLVDTGTTITMVDPSLAAELHLNNVGTAALDGVGFRTSAPLARLELITAGARSLTDQIAVVQDLKHLEGAELNIRGILGGSFLGHYDVLIDNAHRMLCLDAGSEMRSELKGQRIALQAMPQAPGDEKSTMPLILTVHLDAIGTRQLRLDSGTNISLLYDLGKYADPTVGPGHLLHGRIADGGDRAFALLPPREVKVGEVACHNTSFIALVAANKSASSQPYDGLLATGLFRRVFISYAERFVVLEPW